jgi:hypothetical protein
MRSIRVGGVCLAPRVRWCIYLIHKNFVFVAVFCCIIYSLKTWGQLLLGNRDRGQLLTCLNLINVMHIAAKTMSMDAVALVAIRQSCCFVTISCGLDSKRSK